MSDLFDIISLTDLFQTQFSCLSITASLFPMDPSSGETRLRTNSISELDLAVYPEPTWLTIPGIMWHSRLLHFMLARLLLMIVDRFDGYKYTMYLDGVAAYTTTTPSSYGTSLHPFSNVESV